MTNERYSLYAAKAEICDLQAWQNRQNGSLQRIEEKVDGLSSRVYKLILTFAGGMVAIVGSLIGVIFGILC